MKIAYLVLLALSVSVPSVVMAFDSDFKAWKWRRSIDVHGSKGFVKIKIDPNIFNDSQPSLADLRIVDGGNNLVPHLLEWGHANRESAAEWESARLLNSSRTDRKYSRVVADFGRLREKNAVQVSVSGTNFRRRVDVEGSNDSIGWDKVTGNFLLFDITAQERRHKVDILNLPRNNYRFLRLTVYNMPDETEPITIEGVRCSNRTTVTQRDLIPVPTKAVSISQTKDSRETLIQIDLGFQNLPVSRMVINTDNPYFHRGYTISGTNSPLNGGRDGTSTRDLRTRPDQSPEPIRFIRRGVLYRIRSRDGLSECVTIEDREIRYRYLELRIHDGDNPPLMINGVALWRSGAEVVFEAKSGWHYSLIGGNPTAHEPDYDLSSSLKDLSKHELPGAEIGPGTKIPEERAPWTERHGTLILVVLAAASGTIAIFIIKSMKSLPKDN